jgi:hypothetical protein
MFLFLHFLFCCYLPYEEPGETDLDLKFPDFSDGDAGCKACASEFIGHGLSLKIHDLFDLHQKPAVKTSNSTRRLNTSPGSGRRFGRVEFL